MELCLPSQSQSQWIRLQNPRDLQNNRAIGSGQLLAPHRGLGSVHMVHLAPASVAWTAEPLCSAHSTTDRNALRAGGQPRRDCTARDQDMQQAGRQDRGPLHNRRCPCSARSRSHHGRLPGRQPARVHQCCAPCAGQQHARVSTTGMRR